MPAWVYLLLVPVAVVALLLLPGAAEAVGRAARMVAPPTPPPDRPTDPRVAAARAEYLALVRRTRELERRNRRRRKAG